MNDKIIKIEVEDCILFDKIHNISIEYATSVDFLVNIAIKRLLDDIEFIRSLRTRSSFIHPQDEQT